MLAGSVRPLRKSVIPTPVRRVLRVGLHYVQRLGRWAIILWQIRGRTWKDEWSLIRSALASPMLASRNLLGWQDPILLSDADLVVRGMGFFRVRAYSDDLWHVLPWRERAIFRHLADVLRPGDLFIDAGANIGCYTILAGKLVGRGGRVHAFEMMPDTALRLADHVTLNGLDNVTIHQRALSSRPGERLSAAVTDGRYGQASIARKSAPADRYVEVETTTLDWESGSIDHVRVMKMDLEGAELSALEGAKSLLERTDYVIYERRREDVDGDPVGESLKTLGYRVHALDRNNFVAERLGTDA